MAFDEVEGEDLVLIEMGRGGLVYNSHPDLMVSTLLKVRGRGITSRGEDRWQETKFATQAMAVTRRK